MVTSITRKVVGRMPKVEKYDLAGVKLRYYNADEVDEILDRLVHDLRNVAHMAGRLRDALVEHGLGDVAEGLLG